MGHGLSFMLRIGQPHLTNQRQKTAVHDWHGPHPIDSCHGPIKSVFTHHASEWRRGMDSSEGAWEVAIVSTIDEAAF